MIENLDSVIQAICDNSENVLQVVEFISGTIAFGLGSYILFKSDYVQESLEEFGYKRITYQKNDDKSF